MADLTIRDKTLYSSETMRCSLCGELIGDMPTKVVLVSNTTYDNPNELWWAGEIYHKACLDPATTNARHEIHLKNVLKH